MRRLLLIPFFCTTLNGAIYAGDSVKTHSVVPCQRYQAGSVYRRLYGDQWRDLWTTAIEVPELNMETFAGGLKILRDTSLEGRGQFLFQGGDGRAYVFQPLAKDPKFYFPPEVRNFFDTRTLDDLTSGAYPFAPLIVASLLRGIGVLHSDPFLVLLPNDERLGEFKPDFAGKPGFIQYHPRGLDKSDWGFGGADEILSTEDMIQLMTASSRYRVDAGAYLKARLFDIFVGDWNRDPSHWRWALILGDSSAKVRPIPEDRDHVFARFDGILPWIAIQNIPQFCDFSSRYPSIEKLTYSMRWLDRRILPSLTQSQWKSIVGELQNRLTDSLIAIAVKNVPMVIYEKSGGILETTLRERRNTLREAAEEFYKEMFTEVDIHCTDESERIEIAFSDHDTTELSIRSEQNSSLLFENKFSNDVTENVRIYFHDGVDRFLIKGESGGPFIYLLAGDGQKIIIDSTTNHRSSYALFSTTSSAKRDANVSVTEPRSEKTQQLRGMAKGYRDEGDYWTYWPWASVSREEGFYTGIGGLYRRYGFLAEPYLYELSMEGGVSTLNNNVQFEATAKHNGIVRGLGVFLSLRYTTMDVLWFFGEGNEIAYHPELLQTDFYRADHQSLSAITGIEIGNRSEWYIRLNLGFARSTFTQKVRSLIDILQPYGIEGRGYLMIGMSLRHDTRDNVYAPRKGAYVDIVGQLYPEIWDNPHLYARIHADGRGYIPFAVPFTGMLALRVAGGQNFGTVPFFDNYSIGGWTTIRGFERNRFSGKGMVLGNAELRFDVGELNLIFPSRYGCSLFVESGRVFVNNEQSKLWHSSAGGGVWFAPISPDLTVVTSVAHSAEGIYINAQIGFSY
jgi:hypothetical protein